MAENGETNNYTIQLKIKENVSKNASKEKFEIDNKFLIGGGVIVSLIVICFIIKFIKNRRIEKALDRL